MQSIPQKTVERTRKGKYVPRQFSSCRHVMSLTTWIRQIIALPAPEREAARNVIESSDNPFAIEILKALGGGQ